MGYPRGADLAGQVGRAEMKRLPRLPVPRYSVHVVGRCNNREFCFTTAEDFGVLLGQSGAIARTYEVRLYAYTLTANHVHLVLQAPLTEPLARHLRWFSREAIWAWQRTRERRYWACLVEDDTYALAALRCLDRNLVRAGLVEDPATYPWSSCAAYAIGAPNPPIAFHPSHLALSTYRQVRQRHYRALLAPSGDARADARDPRWTSDRAVGSPAFLARVLPRRSRRRIGNRDEANQ